MHKPRNRIAKATGHLINKLPRKTKKQAKRLVKAVNKYKPQEKGRKMIYDAGHKLLHGKKRRR